MFRKKVFFSLIVFLLAFVILSSSAFAVFVHLTKPVDKYIIKDDEEVFLGRLAPGGEFEVLASVFLDTKKKTFFWKEFEILEKPNGIETEKLVPSTELVGLKIKVARDMPLGIYVISLRAKELAGRSKDLFFKISFEVAAPREIFVTTIDNERKNVYIDEIVPFTVTIKNTSLSKEKIIFYASLPISYFGEIVYELNPGEEKQLTMNIDAKTYGERFFVLYLKHQPTQSIFKTFDVSMNIKPTIQSKLYTIRKGFPVTNLYLTITNFFFSIFF